jgi:uracil-DNA glycosylase family 4
LEILNQELMACDRCPRLRAHCQKISTEKKRAFREWEYWGRPVPGFGEAGARVLILGLAPGAHGSNRTGRPFTGDGSGNFLYPVLHRAGFASQRAATHRGDGMRLRDAYITSVVRCAPPQNKPTPQELANCTYFLDRELAALGNVKVVVALGKIAFDGYISYLLRTGAIAKRTGYVFAHGAKYQLPNGKFLLATYHPSLQNTNTGKLTRAMLLKVFRTAATLAKREGSPQ